MAKVNMNDIARLAGVSIGTVDRVIHSRGHVSKEKENLIRSLCKEYNYEVNPAGKAMFMQQREHRIAFLVVNPKLNDFCESIQNGAMAALSKLQNYRITGKFFHLNDFTEEEMLEKLEDVEKGNYDGLIIKPYNSEKIKERLCQIARTIPVVTCTSDLEFDGKLCFVGQDHLKEGMLLANLLLMIKKDEILKILILTDKISSVARHEKLRGFLSYLNSHKARYEILEKVEVMAFDHKAGRELERILALHPDANVLYLHPSDLESCYPVLNKKDFKGITVSYGHSGKTNNPIKSGAIDFEIYEEPYQQGYESVMAVFNYILNKDIPENRKILFEGYLAMEANA